MKEIVKKYRKGLTIPELSKIYHKRKSYISQVLRDNGIDTVANSISRMAKTKSNKPIKSLIIDRSINNINDIDLAYISGFFDAEGCIEKANRNPKTKKYNGYRISLSQNSKSELERIRKIIGCGNIYKNSLKNKNYVYKITSQRAVFQFLISMSPYLIVKRIKAQEAILNYNSRYGWNEKYVKEISNKEKWAYIAGMLDGDGCVGINNNKITIVQKGLYLHKWLKKNLRYGTIQEKKSNINSFTISALLHRKHFINNIILFTRRVTNSLLLMDRKITSRIDNKLNKRFLKLPKIVLDI